MYQNFFIHSSVDGHLGCFHVLAIVNSAAVNIGVHVSFSVLVSFDWLLAQTVKRLPAMRETRVLSLGWEAPLERKWQPIPVFLPGESHGARSPVGYSPWGHKSVR